MTNATTKSSFLATPKSDILCNTEVQHRSLPFLQSEFQHFLQQKLFVAKKNVEILIAKMVDFRVAVLHKISDFGVARKLDFVVALVIVADNSLLKMFKKYSDQVKEENNWFMGSKKFFHIKKLTKFEEKRDAEKSMIFYLIRIKTMTDYNL